LANQTKPTFFSKKGNVGTKCHFLFWTWTKELRDQSSSQSASADPGNKQEAKQLFFDEKIITKI
jgi:hypothetical protein